MQNLAFKTTGTLPLSCFSQMRFLGLTSHFQAEDHPPLVSTLCASGRGLALV